MFKKQLREIAYYCVLFLAPIVSFFIAVPITRLIREEQALRFRIPLWGVIYHLFSALVVFVLVVFLVAWAVQYRRKLVFRLIAGFWAIKLLLGFILLCLVLSHVTTNWPAAIHFFTMPILSLLYLDYGYQFSIFCLGFYLVLLVYSFFPVPKEQGTLP